MLWLTEEGESFGETAKRFGIAPGLVTVLQRHEVRTTEWPAIVHLVRREAWRRGCAYVIVDTIRAWCPQAEQSNDHAAAVFNLARREWAARGLGVLFVHHDRKGGGDFGEGVAGPNNLVGSCDVLIELRRVEGRRHRAADARLPALRRPGRDGPPGRPPLRRGGRRGGLSRTTRTGTRPRRCPAHLQATLDALRQAGAAGMTVEALQVAMVVAGTTAFRRLAALEGLGLAVPQGTGVKGAPRVWRAVEEPPAPGPPPTADPAYRRYLNSQAWAAKRAEILARADGLCEECGAPLQPEGGRGPPPQLRAGGAGAPGGSGGVVSGVSPARPPVGRPAFTSAGTRPTSSQTAIGWSRSRRRRRSSGTRSARGRFPPDGCVVLPTGERIAVEVELHAKGYDRLAEKLRWYHEAAGYAEVLWLVPAAGVEEPLWAAIAEVDPEAELTAVERLPAAALAFAGG